MKEKEASPRKTTSPRKSSKLVMDVNIKTQMKKRADASRAAVKERHNEKDGTKKKEVTFAENVEEQKVTEPEETEEQTPREHNNSTESINEEDTVNCAEDGENEKTPREDDKTTTEGAEPATEDAEQMENKDEEKEEDENKKDKDDQMDDEKEDKKGKKGKKKGGKAKPKKEIKKKVEKPKPMEIPTYLRDKKQTDEMQRHRNLGLCTTKNQGEVTAGTEEFRTFIFDKVQTAFELVCTDGITDTNVDNVTPLLKSLDVDTSDEGVIDLMRDALVDNFGVINPLDLDQVVQKAQEANELTEMDDCLEVAFKLIDFDEDEFITQKDIYKLGLRLGEELAEFALDEMVDAVDMDKDGKISLRDFRYFLLGRDVPSRKEIFAMAEAARKKREEEEERKRQEEEKKENERQAMLYQKIKDGEIIEMENGEGGEKKEGADSEEGGEKEEGLEEDVKSAEGSDHVTVEEKIEEIKPVEEKEEKPKTEAELLREKRKNMFAGYAKAVTAAKVIANKSGNSFPEETPRDVDGDNNGDDASIVKENDEIGDKVEENNDNGNDVFQDDADDDDDEDDSDREDVGPIPLQTNVNLNLPPPDLSLVSHCLPSPLVTPCTTPRGPTIVGIGGLGVSNPKNNSSYTDAIQRLEEDMFRGDNRVPQRPRRRRSTCSSIDDIEDYNNRLVYKLPPLRRPSCTPPAGAQRQNSISDRRPSQISNISTKYAMATDSDEGIDLADEEVVEPTVILPHGAAAPSVSLRISLPQGHDSEGAYDADKMNVSIVTRRSSRRRSSSSSASIKIDDRGVATLGVGPYGDTPRSTTRSEMSVTHISLLSPRLSDDNEDEEEYDLETTTSKAAVHTTSNTSGYDCDNDSIVLSLNEGEINDPNEVEDISKAQEKLSHYKKGRLKKSKLRASESVNSSQDREASPTPSLTRRKSALSTNKRSLSCQKIEIKELALNEPVPVGQFSNRHKFGMIPRDVSKFIVLGKNPTNEDQPNSFRTTAIEEEPMETQPKKSATVRWRELPDMIRPILRNNTQERRSTVTHAPSTAPVKEHNVLQGRRLSLFHDINSPVLKNRQDFDLPILPNKIQIPTGTNGSTASSTNNIPALDNIKKMERKILKRSQTSFELPNLYEANSDGVQTARSDLSNKSRRSSSSKSRPLSAAARRKSSPIVSYDSDGGGGRYSARNRKVSIVDLSKSLRRDNACKNTASLSKKHSGFKSIVPLARVVMAYQSTKKKHREAGGFYSISRQLEKSGVPFSSTSASYSSSPRRNASDSIGAQYKLDGRKRRCRSAKGRTGGNSNSSSKNETDDLYLPVYDEDVQTLVGDFKDPDIIPAQVVFQKVRPATAHAGSLRNFQNSNLNGSLSGSRSNIVTLEIPETSKYEKKLKNVSLLSKLPIK